MSNYNNDVILDQETAILQLEKQLRFAAGLLSTHPPFTDRHPEDVLDYIKRHALAGSVPR